MITFNIQWAKINSSPGESFAILWLQNNAWSNNDSIRWREIKNSHASGVILYTESERPLIMTFGITTFLGGGGGENNPVSPWSYLCNPLFSSLVVLSIKIACCSDLLTSTAYNVWYIECVRLKYISLSGWNILKYFLK